LEELEKIKLELEKKLNPKEEPSDNIYE